MPLTAQSRTDTLDVVYVVLSAIAADTTIILSDESSPTVLEAATRFPEGLVQTQRGDLCEDNQGQLVEISTQPTRPSPPEGSAGDRGVSRSRGFHVSPDSAYVPVGFGGCDAALMRITDAQGRKYISWGSSDGYILRKFDGAWSVVSIVTRRIS